MKTLVVLLVLFFAFISCSRNQDSKRGLSRAKENGRIVTGDNGNMKRVLDIKMEDDNISCSVFVNTIDKANKDVFNILKIKDEEHVQLYKIEKNILSNTNGIDIEVNKDDLYGYRFIKRNKDGFVIVALYESGERVSDNIWIKWNKQKELFEVQKIP